jgi:4-diphosphocytidyl-2-C-methyl-D-erythritol kinase
MRLIKRIPIQAGLGGGSSDAAAALCVANRAWGVNWPAARLAELGAELGSDIPFFVYGRSAICRGRGERVEPLVRALRLHFVVAHPADGLSTKDVFANCRAGDCERSAEELAAGLASGDVRRAARHMYNDLQEPAIGLCPDIARLKESFERTGFVAHQMSGSGVSYFGVCRTARQAQRLAGRLRAQYSQRVVAAHCLN